MRNPLYVAKPLLPDLGDVTRLLGDIWASGIVTNEGPMHNLLEARLASKLEVPVAKLFNNGTVAMQCALLSLNLPAGAEIITTPLTFAATAHVIAASGFVPVFADVCEDTLTLDPKSVELAITERTAAVIAVHVYGTMCDVDGLQRICTQHNLKLIFDSAHAFAAADGDVPAGAMGDMSVFSLHATKLFNTFEGGLVTSSDPEMGRKLRLVRNFGIESEERVSVVGLNGKMNEMNAAIGLLNLDLFEAEREKRSELRAKYDSAVDAIPGLRKQTKQPKVKQSEQYYVVVVDPEVYGSTRDDIYRRLKEQNIFSRRYFWPICTDFDCYKDKKIHSVHPSTVAERVKDRVLCLPFHSGVTDDHVDIIAGTLNELRRVDAKGQKVEVY